MTIFDFLKIWCQSTPFREKIARRPDFFDPNPLYLLCYLPILLKGLKLMYIYPLCVLDPVRGTGCSCKIFLSHA